MPKPRTVMIAVDTNVIVRLLTGDDPAQYERARALFASETAIVIPKTVILEAEWVLRRLYRFGRIQTLDALLGLISLPNVSCEGKGSVLDALAWARRGLDFADALHLASARPADQFATFDEAMVKRAAGVAEVTVRLV